MKAQHHFTNRLSLKNAVFFSSCNFLPEFSKRIMAKNLIKSIILAVLRRSVYRVAGLISAAKRLDNTAPQKRRSGSDTASDFTGFGIEHRPPAPLAVSLTTMKAIKD